MTEKTGLELAREREKNIVENTSKFLLDAANLATEEITVPPGIAIGIINSASSIVNGPEIPNPMDINNFIKDLSAQEYEAGPAGEWGWWGTSGATGLVTGGLAYDVALNKIQKAYPKLYKNLTKAFPYSVGQIHGATLEAVKNSKAAVAATAAGKSPLKKISKIGTDLIKRVYPSPSTRYVVGANTARLAGFGLGVGTVANLLMSKPTGGEGMLADTPQARMEFMAGQVLNIDPENIGYEDYSDTELAGLLDPYYFDKRGAEMTVPQSMLEEYIFGEPMTEEESLELTRKKNEEYRAEKERYERLPFNRKVGEYLGDLGEFAKETRIAKAPGAAMDFLTKNKLSQSIASAFVDAKTEEEPYDVVTMTPEYIAEDAKDKAMNEQYMMDKGFGLINQAPFVDNLALGGEPGQFTDSMITGIEEDVNVDDIINQTGFESMSDFDIFEEAKKKGYEEVEVANLVGKAPLWAIGNVDKLKILDQPSLTTNEKKILEDIKNKLGTEEEVTQKIEDIDILDTPSGETTVGTVKKKKTIIDSPEDAENMFYSGLEARLMDPNTPKTFNTVEDFYKFLQNKQISKKEVGDNILDKYLAIATKNKTPLQTADMLKIVRQAPMRKVETVIYGDAAYGGTKMAKYPGYQESGALPNSYRESVLFLDPKYIPQDPDKVPGSVHDFAERYVIGWSRKTDRIATLPVEKTAQGIAEQVDPAMIRTLKRNQTKLKNQLKGLEASAYEKIRRAVDGDLTPTDEMNARMITETIDSRMAFLEELDTPLANQIRQFRSKIQDDSVKLKDMEAATTGQKTIVTFADEIQSDILQQAKKLENDLREQLGAILDLPKEKRLGALAQERTRYSGSAKNVEPEVLEFYTANETIFRPMFSTAEEMQGFVDEFIKNKQAIEVVAKGGPAPSDEAVKAMNIAIAKEKKMLEELNVGLSDNALKQLFPNVPFKNREEWGDILIKRDLTEAAQRLFVDKVDNAAQWYAVSPAKFIQKRYGQSGGTATPINQRTKDMKGIGTEEFYGGPNSVDSKGKHYTSTVEKALKRAARENNSEFKIIEVDGVGKVFAIKITPEMLLPHKTHRKKGGMVYTPEIIDIFEAA
jgi:hypothetical protein